MRKKLFFLPLVAALALTGCSSEDLPADEGGAGGDVGDGRPRFLSVSIVSSRSNPNGMPGAYSRAEGDAAADGAAGEDTDQKDPQLPPEYEYGTDTENKVERVRFYFFSNSNDAAAVKKGSTVNYYDWVPTADELGTSPNPDPTNTVERQLNAVLLIETSAGDRLPAKIIAVVNPDESRLGTGSMSVTQLREVFADYAALANGTSPEVTSPEFVMSNSTYMNASGVETGAAVVKPENYAESAEDAKTKYPVQIYVERTVAKVRVRNSVPLEESTMRIPVKDKNGNQYEFDSNGNKVKVYLTLNGWNLTSTLPAGYLSKHIDVKWTTGWVPKLYWNDYQNYRSYWASECTRAGGSMYIPFVNMDDLQFSGKNYTYCNENAEHTSIDKFATKVIVSGTLTDESGKSLTLAEYAGLRFLSTDGNLDDLKRAYIFQLESKQRSSSYYKKTVNADGTVGYKKIEATDLTFQTAAKAGKFIWNPAAYEGGSYYVYACLTPDAAKAEWYTTDNPTNAEDAVTAAEINTLLTSLPPAKIWRSGNTYYFVNIDHYGRAGVVRNHIYDVNFTGVVGLGTPVFDPEETIYPEVPEKSNTFIAAKVKILAWRVSTQNVVLDGEEK